MKILIIEDDDKFRTWLLDVLQKAGYQTFESNNGKQALEWIQKNNINLIITDIVMPQVDGLEVLFEVKKNFPHIPAIAMSEGVISFDYCVKVTEAAGGKKFLPKPFQPNDLFNAIREVKGKEDEIAMD